MDTVYQAISALYDNPNASEKEKASIWLGDIQKSVSTPLFNLTIFFMLLKVSSNTKFL